MMAVRLVMMPKQMLAICQADICIEKKIGSTLFSFTSTRSMANSKFPILGASKPLDTFLNLLKEA
jgi:hypothetical protein